MTDGPQKSLPMNYACKRLAAKLANPNSTLPELSDAAWSVLSPLVSKSFIERVRALIVPRGLGTLFSADPVALKLGLRDLEPDVTGSSFCRSLLNFCSAKVIGGRDGSEILSQGVAFALAAEFESHSRSMVEHWKRRAPREAGVFRGRCIETRQSIDFGAMAARVLSSDRAAMQPVRNRFSGLDEGVPK